MRPLANRTSKIFIYGHENSWRSGGRSKVLATFLTERTRDYADDSVDFGICEAAVPRHVPSQLNTVLECSTACFKELDNHSAVRMLYTCKVLELEQSLRTLLVQVPLYTMSRVSMICMKTVLRTWLGRNLDIFKHFAMRWGKSYVYI
jgi:hypothetical protein